MSFYYPTKEEEDEILKEIGYSRSQLEKDIPSLRKWLEEQTHLPACRLKESDIFLSNFLVGCKGSIEKSKRKLDHYYSLRGKGDAFSERGTLDYVDAVSKYAAIVELPKPTPEGNSISMTMAMDDNLDLYEPIDTMKKLAILFELRLRSVPISRQHIYVLDSSNYSISHFMKIPPSANRMFVSFFQDAYPVRVKKILITNVPSVLAAAINTVVVPFFSKKMKERIQLTSDSTEKAFKYVELLPRDIEGGKASGIKELNEAWANVIKSSQIIKDLLPQFQEVVDESKRPQLNNGNDDPYFGLHGSIKTLVLD